MKLPQARNKNVVVQILDKEILVYDLATHHAYHLNKSCAIVYQMCDGLTTLDELQSRYHFTADVIYLALDELQKNNLIDRAPLNSSTSLSRREAIRRAALASFASLPIVSFIVAPTPPQTASACACERSFPDGCIAAGSLNVGCYDSAAACFEAGGGVAGLGCCAGVGKTSYIEATGCCTVACAEQVII